MNIVPPRTNWLSDTLKSVCKATVALLASLLATLAVAQTSTVITNPAIGVFTGGVNLTARIDSTSVSGVVITVKKTVGTFIGNGVLRLCRGEGNVCEMVAEIPYAAGAASVTFPSFTPRLRRQDFYYVQRFDAVTIGGLDPNVRSSPMIIIADSRPVGRENVAQVNVDQSYACVVTTSGGVKCWGGGDAPVPLAGAPAAVVKVAGSAASGAFSCLLASGTVYCWGGSVGDGTTLSRTTPVPIAGIPGPVTDIFVGYNRACALTGTAVWCWRDYGYEVASGYQPSPPYPATLSPVAFTALGNAVTDMSMNTYGACALKSSGEIVCWGTNVGGNLGNPNGENTGTLFPATAVAGVTGRKLANHSNLPGGHVCAATYANDLWCWGSNSSLQLGRIASATPTSQPAPATLVAQNVVDATLGGGSTCATHPGGKVSCWGDNARGRLGVGGVAEYEPTGGRTGIVNVPTPVSLGDAEVSRLSLSSSKSCFVLTDGSIRCAGPVVSVNTTAIPSSTAFSVDGFGPIKSLLTAPTILQISRVRDVVSIRYQDNAVSGTAPITAHHWACYPQSNGNIGNAAEVITNEAPGALHVVQGTLSTRTGPWQCKVRFVTPDGVSAWSALVPLAQNVVAVPTVTSAVYDGAYGTVSWRDNATDAAGPIISKTTYCNVQWMNAPTVQVSGCEPQNARCFLFSSVTEPTNLTHVSRLPLPPATDFSSGTCRVVIETLDGSEASAYVPLVPAASPAPTIVSGRVVGTQAVLTFADNRADSASVILSAAYACTRIRDGATTSTAVSINEPANSQHTITVPLLGNNMLQDPDTYSCKVRVTPSVGTVSGDSPGFTIGPNTPPVVSNFTFTSNNGVITGSFDINDPEGDQVKNVIAYFGSSPRSMECSSGALGASWDVPRGGGRVQFNASLTNVGCGALTGSATTIYGFVTAQDVNGLYATIVQAQASNTPPAPVPVTSATTYSFVFDAVPTTLPVRQPAQDITIRVVDQLGVTATQFNGPARITLSVSGVTSDFDDPNQPAAQQSAHRTVWLKNGVGRIRAFRVNEPSVFSIVAVAKADSGFNLQPAAATAGFNGLKAALAFNTQSYLTGQSAQMSSGGATSFSSSVSLTMPIGGALYNSLRADFISGVVTAYLRDKQGVLRGPAGVSANGLTLGFGSNRGEFDLVFKRNGATISTYSIYTVNVNAAAVAVNNLLTTHLPSDRSVTRRRVILLHGIFGSTLNTSSTKCVVGGLVNTRAVAPEMPDQHCARAPSVTGAFPVASCNDLRFACFDAIGPLGEQMLWGQLEDRLVEAGYDVVPVAYDWRVKPSSVAMDYLAPAVKKARDETLLPVDIVAHSMGGIVALNFLKDSQYRSYVDRLVLLGSPLAGSVNAYGLMEVGDPLGVDGVTKVGDSFYASAAEKLWRWKQPSSNLFTTSASSGSDTYSSAANQTLRQRVFAEAAPAGFYLYPDQSFLPFTGASSLTSHRPSEYLDPDRIFRGADWADAPNRFGFASLSAYAECSSNLVARNSGISKTRVSALYSNDQPTKSVVNFANGNDLNTFLGLQVPQRFTKAFVRWTNEPSGGDGTVPLRGQLNRFAHLLGLSGPGSVAACKEVNSYGLHAKLTNNANAITWAVGRLQYPGLAAAAAAAASPDVTKALAIAAPNLSIRANTANEVTANVTGMSAFGSSRFLANPSSVSGTAGLVGTAYADSASTTVEITNPPVGQSVITLTRQSAETVTLDRLKVAHTDATPTTNEYEISVLVRGTQSTGIAITSTLASSQLLVKTQGPDPVTNLRSFPTSVGTTLSWSPPAAGIAVSGYRIFASKPHEQTWSLVGAVAAGTTSYAAPFPAASLVQQEIAFVVVSADAQDRYSEVLDFANNRVRDDVEGSFGTGRGNPGTLVLSPIVPMPNNVPISASVTGGEASVNGGAWLSTGLLIPPFANVQVRGVASSTTSQWTTVTLNGPTSSSSFSILAAPPIFCRRPTRPVVESGAFIRYLDGIAGTPLMQGLYPAAEVSPTAASTLGTHYSDNLDAYDFNGDGFSSVDIDGLLYARYALGFRGAALVSGIAVGTSRTTTQIQAALAACQ